MSHESISVSDAGHGPIRGNHFMRKRLSDFLKNNPKYREETLKRQRKYARNTKGIDKK